MDEPGEGVHAFALPGPDGVLDGVWDELGGHRGRGAPADDPPGVGVDDERDVDPNAVLGPVKIEGIGDDEQLARGEVATSSTVTVRAPFRLPPRDRGHTAALPGTVSVDPDDPVAGAAVRGRNRAAPSPTAPAAASTAIASP